MKNLIKKVLRESDLDYYGVSNATKDKYVMGLKEDDSEEIGETPVTSTPKPPSNFSLDTNQAKQSKVDKFDSLFDSKDSTNKVDDLPF